MKILTVQIIVNDTIKYKVKEKEIEKETNKSYITTSKKIIPKNKILIPNTLIKNSVYSKQPTISYHCYCLLEDLKQAKIILFEKTRDRILSLNDGVQTLVNLIN